MSEVTLDAKLKDKNTWMGRHNIPNSWIASVPGHPFWIYLLQAIIDTDQKAGGAEYISGFIILSNIFKVLFD
jgi:hypothetical protein